MRCRGVEMSTESQIEKLIPKSLAEVTTTDQFQLALATADEISNLEAAVPESTIRETLTNWQLVVLHAAKSDGTRAISPRLVGVTLTGESWMTSHVTALDSGRGLVQTANSVYRVLGPKCTEEELDYPYICATLHSWGLGRFGVPHFFF